MFFVESKLICEHACIVFVLISLISTIEKLSEWPKVIISVYSFIHKDKTDDQETCQKWANLKV